MTGGARRETGGLGSAAYRGLQVLLPSEFRAAHGEEMREMFELRLGRTMERFGRLAAIRHAGLEMSNLVVSAVRLHVRRVLRWSRQRQLLRRGTAVVLMGLCYAALDDITTGTESDYTIEWVVLTVATVVLATMWLGRPPRPENGAAS